MSDVLVREYASCCPLCDAEIFVQEPRFLGCISCASCEKELWYMDIPDDRRFFSMQHSDHVLQSACEFIGEELGVSPEEVTDNPDLLIDNGVDSLQLLQIVMDMEEQLGLVTPTGIRL